MSRKILTFVFLAFAVVSASCTDKKADLFSIFGNGFYAEIAVTFGENECVIRYDGFEKSAEFVTPEVLSGIVMKLENGEPRLLYGDINVAVSRYGGRLVYLCEAVFSVNSDSVTDIKAKEIDGNTVTIVKTNASEYAFSSDGIPISVSGYYDEELFKMTFLSFTGEMK